MIETDDNTNSDIYKWQILAVFVAEIVAENKKPPDNQEVLSLVMQSVGESKINQCNSDS